MKQLDVPLHLQAPGSEDCGPISSTMVLDYFGFPVTPADIIAKVPRCEWGTDTFGNANVLAEYGLKVKLVTKSPLLFNGDFLRTNPSRAAILAHIRKLESEISDKDKKGILNRLLQFLDNKGELLIEIPSEKLIKETIDNNGLVMASLYGKVLGKDEGTYHFVVVGGYNEDSFYVYNPWPKSRQKSWENQEDFMFAIHVSTLFDYDNGAILCVTKN